MRGLRTAGSLLWRAQPGTALLMLAGACVLGAVPVAAAWLTKIVIDNLNGANRGSGLWPAAFLVAVLLLGQLGQSWLRYVQDQLTNRMELTAKGDLFAALNRHHGLEVFEQPDFHDALQLGQRATQLAPNQLVQVATSTILGITSLAGFIGVLVAISPPVAALAAVAVVPHLVAELRLTRIRIEIYQGLSPAQRRTLFYAGLQSEPQAAKEVRIFGLGAFFHARMMTELETILRSERGLARRILRNQVVLDSLSALMTGFGILVIIRSATAGRVGPGDVTVVLSALPGLALSATGLVRQFAQGAEALLLVGRLQQLIELAPPACLTGTGATPAPLDEGVTVDDVWFRYGDDLPWVLRGVTLHLRPGDSLGLVGLNGAGKSTLVKLLTGLYEPTKGRICWNGVDLRTLDQVALRNRIGVVFQDYMTYDLTAADNIGLGDLDRFDDADRIEDRARLAGLDGLVRGYPHGYQTMLSRRYSADDHSADGVLPSGGQWQRFALARMLMRTDRDLLILDEPSSNLDPEAEYEVHQLVHRLTAGATRLLVSHRLNAVRMADRIVVLADGVVAEQGSHADLIRANSRYAELFHRQAAGYRD
ncbi:ABC transporter ATP-binding protein [Kribbella sp. NPDC026611]|uniref:ABC transporter ATP-binding protein n=1 Tax=Kribbella sp. NPDC026611 TaxID=3154911 RepID=UPI0033FBBE96